MFGFIDRRVILALIVAITMLAFTASILTTTPVEAEEVGIEDWRRCYDLSVADSTYTQGVLGAGASHPGCADATVDGVDICTVHLEDGASDYDLQRIQCLPPPGTSDEQIEEDLSQNLEDVTTEQACTAMGGLWIETGGGWRWKCVPQPKYVKAESTEPCRVEGIGHFFCPIINTTADFMDTAFAFLSDNFLVMKPQLVKGDETRQAWERFRDIANVLFVMGFLVIVYSQITGAGLSNYGIKKMLPKLIVVAILVNLSYFICHLAIDISNYLGYALAQFFGVALLPQVEGSNVTNNIAGAAGTVAVIVAAILAAGFTLYLTLSMGVLIPAVLSLILVMIILITRQALIILLLVISPIAFVAYLLPNTEHLLKKWWQMFYALLIIFPIIGLIFGASKMVSGIIMTGVNMPENPGDPLPPGLNFLLALMAIGVSALPFIAVPTILKGSLKATGALGAKLEGGVDKLGGMAGKTAKSNAKEKYDQSYIKKYRDAKEKERNVRNAKIAGGTYDYSGKNPIKKFNKHRSRMHGWTNTHGISGTAGDKMAAMGASLEAKEREEDIKAVDSRLVNSGIAADNDALLALERGETIEKNGYKINGDSATTRMAVRDKIIKNGDVGTINKMLNSADRLKGSNSKDAVELNRMADTFESSGTTPKFVQAKNIAAMRHNGSLDSDGNATSINSGGMMTQALKDNVYGPEGMATTGRNETGEIRKHIGKLQASSGYAGSDEEAAVNTYIDNARALTGDKRASFKITDELRNRLSKQSEDVHETAKGNFPKPK